MPDNELMNWTAGVTSWLSWYDYVQESSSWYDSSCPEEVQDSPVEYNNWLSQQKSKEKTKNNAYGS